MKIGDVGGGAVDTAVDVVLTADTGARVIIEGGWTQLAEGFITAVNPPFGQHKTAVTIEGTGMLSGGASVVSVTLAGVEVDAGGWQ